MKKDFYSTAELTGAPVYEMKKQKNHRLGKIHRFIFHPQERKIIGFTVKRPDVALMFHRSDKVIAFDKFDVEQGQIVIDSSEAQSGPSVCKRFGVSWKECLIWHGLPLVTESGKKCGYVGDVVFSTHNGAVQSLTIDRGKSAEFLLGYTEVPASLIKGFRFCVGEPLDSISEDEGLCGAMVVADEVATLKTEGGVAEKAGAASAKAGYALNQAQAKLKPKQDAATEKTGEALNKGAYALGSHLAKTKGMFASFKDEYRKARHSDDA